MYRVLKYLLEVLLMFVVFAACDITSMEKYVIVMCLCILFFLLSRKKRWSADILTAVSLPIVTYLLIGCFNAVINANAYNTTIKIVIFWLIPLLFAFSLYTFYGQEMARIVDAEFFGSCIAYLAINARFLIYYRNVESTFSFVFGIFFLYYVYKKKWPLCAIAALFMYFTDKRITMLAVIAVLVIMLVLWLFRKDRKLVFMVWGMAMVIIQGYLWLIYSGTFEYYCKGFGLNTNGRVKIYSQVIEWFDKPVLYLGRGIGIVEKLLEVWNIRAFANLHNDLLKFYIELGVIGLFIFLLSYGASIYLVERKFGKEKMCIVLAMFVYSMMLFATDNVSIYILYLIPFYSVLFAILSSNQENRSNIKQEK